MKEPALRMFYFMKQEQQLPLLRHGELLEALQLRSSSPLLSSLPRWVLDLPWGLRGSGRPCASSSPPPAACARPPDTVVCLRRSCVPEIIAAAK
ncbi:hypothetical protein CHARACLAT_002667, partial [Characodon lateralis]|nr:hypothetical protein [Characodon lateralis]